MKPAYIFKKQKHLKRIHYIYNRMEQLNIVELIESNPITKLTDTYNSKLLSKIKESFTGFEQQLFISSFYCYLKYDKTLEVDLDDVWKWLGFNQKVKALSLLEKHFVIDKDYKKSALPTGKASLEEKHGGQNIKKIMLTIKCFKSLCLKSQTKKASEIHEYYMKLEEVLQETLDEETIELKLQLEQKENIILEKDKEKEKLMLTSKQEKYKAVEETLISQFPKNTDCIYFGIIYNTNENGEKLIKFGRTHYLLTRVRDHRKTYSNFILIKAFKVINSTKIESEIKEHKQIRRQIRKIKDENDENRTETIAYDDINFTISRLTKYIEELIHQYILYRQL
jgi:hypothetical protein